MKTISQDAAVALVARNFFKLLKADTAATADFVDAMITFVEITGYGGTVGVLAAMRKNAQEELDRFKSVI